MADQFVAEIRIFPFNFAPRGWAFCAGQLLPISQNTALFSLLGTNYGGDGKVTFGLPNLQGNAPMFWGQGPGLSLHDIGEESGSETVTLLQTEMPSHNHSLMSANLPGDQKIPDSTMNLSRSAQGTIYNASNSPLVAMNMQTIAPAGGTQPHNNMMPYLTMNFCIAMQGIFPPRG
ncbi:microcystin-dependent protein [Arcicella aurantiaca]|uniref:Microcystin-dependent protein n=1 Tax=Arcicella aurantiaca TaxID=591202 RepID=A0A316EG47_9BACT|nr:tail fiber protein [Arcicella aurantiaca]PWK29071.1 microcystin-dependent protein [Arcicella aurantiaca]